MLKWKSEYLAEFNGGRYIIEKGGTGHQIFLEIEGAEKTPVANYISLNVAKKNIVFQYDRRIKNASIK